MSAAAPSVSQQASPQRRKPERLRHLRLPLPEVALVWLAVLAFVLVSLWWLTLDDRVPDWDSGYHMLAAITYHFDFTHGQGNAWFTSFNTYPPLVHLLGAGSIFLLGIHPMAMIMSSNVVFVPMLAFGCYGTGRIVAGPRAGLLAALLALGTPMFVSMMHEYDLDPPEAALVAMTVWSVLASRRFERVLVSAAAGILFGLAMMTKETAIVFVAGLLVVAILRGGWRRPLGLVAFGLGTGVIAGPWYVEHWTQLQQTLNSVGELAANPVQAPPRFSIANLGWYFWNLINEQTLAVFGAMFLVGVGIAVARSVRRSGRRENVLPELLGGALVAWLGMSYLIHKDPRYTLPGLVYVAVLATYWIVTIRRPALRWLLSGAVVALSIVYFVGMSFGLGRPVRISLPGAQTTIIYQRRFTLYEPTGWVRGGPWTDGHVLSLLERLSRLGVLRANLYVGPDTIDFNLTGVGALLTTANIYQSPTPLPPSPQNAFIFVHTPRPGDPRPCQRLNDGLGIYVLRGNFVGFNPQTFDNPANPRQSFVFACPDRIPVVYRPRR